METGVHVILRAAQHKTPKMKRKIKSLGTFKIPVIRLMTQCQRHSWATKIGRSITSLDRHFQLITTNNGLVTPRKNPLDLIDTNNWLMTKMRDLITIL